MNQAGSSSAENLDVLALRGPESMQHDAPRTMAFVLFDIEKRFRIARPRDIAGRPVDAIGKVLLALEVANRDRQNLGAEIVRAPGDFRMVGRMARAGEMKKRPSLGPRVAVDQHRLRPAPARPSAIDAVLAAMAKARVIGPRPIHLRRLAVVLFEPRAHFAPKLFLQGRRRREHRVGIGVFGL